MFAKKLLDYETEILTLIKKKVSFLIDNDLRNEYAEPKEPDPDSDCCQSLKYDTSSSLGIYLTILSDIFKAIHFRGKTDKDKLLELERQQATIIDILSQNDLSLIHQHFAIELGNNFTLQCSHYEELEDKENAQKKCKEEN